MLVSAPGKIIITGEHSVVYGYPAVAAAINRRLTINSNMIVKSQIPMGCGMGSSAAYSVALSAIRMKLQGRRLNKSTILKDSLKIEQKYHKNPSGIDTTTSTYGGFIQFQNSDEGTTKKYSQLHIKNKIPKFILINTGKPKETTKEMVELVADIYKRETKRIKIIMDEIGKISKAFLNNLVMNKSLDIKELIKANEEYLEQLGVVSESTMKLVRGIERIGGAAKICGAGGKKQNSGMVLIFHSDLLRIEAFLLKQGIDFFYPDLGVEGVRVEN